MAPASLFTEEQKWVILEFGAVRSIIQVRRNFWKAFKMAPKKVQPACEAGDVVPARTVHCLKCR